MTAEQAFDQHHQAVYDFAYRLTRRADLAEDIVQECFLVLVRAPQRYDPERGTVKTFLFSIARNLTLKHYRDHRAEEGFEEDDVLPAFDPRQSLDVSAAVAAAVSCLPSLQQEALVLFEYMGSTLEEIAAIVGADVGTVKSRLHRARARLRRALLAYGRNLHGAVGKYGAVGK
jgi:RNA polymerase sigma-70 factor (ECF subfamily)